MTYALNAATPTVADGYRPFCSKRCADVDLSRWLRGAYAIPGGNVDEDEDGDDSNAPELARHAAAEPDDRDDEQRRATKASLSGMQISVDPHWTAFSRHL